MPWTEPVTSKELDVRDPEDAEIIALFQPSATEPEKAPEAAPSEPEVVSVHVPASPAGQAVLDETSPQPEVIPPLALPSPPAEILARMGRQATASPVVVCGFSGARVPGHSRGGSGDGATVGKLFSQPQWSDTLYRYRFSRLLPQLRTGGLRTGPLWTGSASQFDQRPARRVPYRALRQSEELFLRG